MGNPTEIFIIKNLRFLLGNSINLLGKQFLTSLVSVSVILNAL